MKKLAIVFSAFFILLTFILGSNNIYSSFKTAAHDTQTSSTK